MSNKLKNFINVRSFEALETQFQDYVAQQNITFIDAASSGVVRERDLVQIDPRLFEKRYPANSFLNSNLAMNNTGGYAKAIESLRIDDEGDFATVGSQADDAGKISINGDDSLIVVKERQAKSNWTRSQVQEAALGGVNLVERYLASHNKIYQRNLDRIAALGVQDVAGSTGLLNFGFTATPAAGAADTLTGQELYDEIAKLLNLQHSAVSNTPEYMADNVIMPTRVFNIAESKILNSAGSAMSVLAALRANFPSVTFAGSEKGDDASLGGSVTVAFSSSEEAMQLRVPVPLEVSEVDARGFKFYVESLYRVAGLDVLETTAGYHLTGL